MRNQYSLGFLHEESIVNWFHFYRTTSHVVLSMRNQSSLAFIHEEPIVTWLRYSVRNSFG